MDEVFLSAGVVAYDVSVAEEFVLVGEEAFEAYGPLAWILEVEMPTSAPKP